MIHLRHRDLAVHQHGQKPASGAVEVFSPVTLRRCQTNKKTNRLVFLIFLKKTLSERRFNEATVKQCIFRLSPLLSLQPG